MPRRKPRPGQAGFDFTDPATLPYAPGSASSKATAEAAAKRAPSHRRRIYLHLLSLLPDGATAPEIEAALKLHRSTVSSRMGELERVNYVRRIGKYRPTPSGNPAEVYVAIPRDNDDPPRPPAKDGPQYVTMEEQDHNRLVKEANDCRLALASFMAAYGNCDIPGALMNLAHKPVVENGLLSEHDACEAAMFAAFVRGVTALGLQFRNPPILPRARRL
jgi:hypothetical protein